MFAKISFITSTLAILTSVYIYHRWNHSFIQKDLLIQNVQAIIEGLEDLGERVTEFSTSLNLLREDFNRRINYLNMAINHLEDGQSVRDGTISTIERRISSIEENLIAQQNLPQYK